jgi:hypothetical protein
MVTTKLYIIQFFLVAAFLILNFLFLKTLFLKRKLHFSLLKELFPSELKDIDSHWSLMWYDVLDMSTNFWFIIPVYYIPKTTSHYSKNALQYHYQLKRVVNYFITDSFRLYFTIRFDGHYITITK